MCGGNGKGDLREGRDSRGGRGERESVRRNKAEGRRGRECEGQQGQVKGEEWQ